MDRKRNCCVKKCCHCETSAHTGRGNPPVLPPVIPSERSESRDLPCSFPFQLHSVRRSFDSLRSLRMTVWVEGWGLGGKSGGLPRQFANWLAMTAFIRRGDKRQFTGQPGKTGKHMIPSSRRDSLTVHFPLSTVHCFIASWPHPRPARLPCADCPPWRNRPRCGRAYPAGPGGWSGSPWRE